MGSVNASCRKRLSGSCFPKKKTKPWAVKVSGRMSQRTDLNRDVFKQRSTLPVVKPGRTSEPVVH